MGTMGIDSPLTYLVRHGEVLNPQQVVYADLDGFGLSAIGREQAAAAARRLPAGAVVVTSPLQRARETAAIIAGIDDTTLRVDDDLSEWKLAQRWAGHRWDALDAAFPGERAAYLAHPRELAFTPETLDQLAERAASSVRRHRESADGPLVIVSHQDPIQAARLALTDRPLDRLNRDKPAHAAIITLSGTGTEAWTEVESWAPGTSQPFPPAAS